jgi:hypothetical protein
MAPGGSPWDIVKPAPTITAWLPFIDGYCGADGDWEAADGYCGTVSAEGLECDGDASMAALKGSWE